MQEVDPTTNQSRGYFLLSRNDFRGNEVQSGHLNLNTDLEQWRRVSQQLSSNIPEVIAASKPTPTNVIEALRIMLVNVPPDVLMSFDLLDHIPEEQRKIKNKDRLSEKYAKTLSSLLKQASTTALHDLVKQVLVDLKTGEGILDDTFSQTVGCHCERGNTCCLVDHGKISSPLAGVSAGRMTLMLLAAPDALFSTLSPQVKDQFVALRSLASLPAPVQAEVQRLRAQIHQLSLMCESCTMDEYGEIRHCLNH